MEEINNEKSREILLNIEEFQLLDNKNFVRKFKITKFFK